MKRRQAITKIPHQRFERLSVTVILEVPLTTQALIHAFVVPYIAVDVGSEIKKEYLQQVAIVC